VRLDTRLVDGTGTARRDLVLAVLAGVAAGGLIVLQAALLARVVDGAFLGGMTLGALAPWLVALAAAALVKAACTWSGEVAAQRFAGRAKRELRARLARRLLDGGPRYAAAERTGELVQTLVGGVEALDAWFAQYLPQLGLAVLVPCLVLGFVFAADPLSGVVLLVTLPLVPVFMALVGAAARTHTRRQWLTLARMGARFLDALQGLATLKAFGRGRAYAAAVAESSERFRRATMGVLRVAFVSALVLELLATLGTAVVAVEVGLRLLYARLAFREALFVLVLAPEFYRPLRSLCAAFHAGMAGREAATRIFEVLDGARRTAPVGPAAVDVPAGPVSIAFEAVTFAYQPGAPPALDAVSFRAEAGTTLALVGASGAGKTTAAHVLLRFVEPDAGRVRAGGRVLSELAPDAWRRQVAWVPQRAHLFHGSVLDNLLLARPDATRAQVDEAVAAAGADAFIRALPNGYDTPVGDGGARLSGGQAQRLALARAFLKDAPVLVLDEPTAQLDLESEALVRAAMTRLRRGRTVLLIAHRLTAVFDAECIALMAGGRVVEAGTHAELLRAGARYARLFAAWGGGAA
jgi:thiol reductant ABC exporter CydD subunit